MLRGAGIGALCEPHSIETVWRRAAAPGAHAYARGTARQVTRSALRRRTSLCCPTCHAAGGMFAAHHMSWTTMLPLTTLGLTWAMIYVLSRNLLITVLIHAMWNSRVFLGSLLGL